MYSAIFIVIESKIVDQYNSGCPLHGIFPEKPILQKGSFRRHVCMHTKLPQSCPTFCDPMDNSPPDSSVHGILQARILENCHSLLHGIFPTQGSNLCLLRLLQWQVGSLPLVPPVIPVVSGCVHVCCVSSVVSDSV